MFVLLLSFQTSTSHLFAQCDPSIPDTTPPIISCPSSATVNLDEGECSMLYIYQVNATDNCGGDRVMFQQSEGPSSGEYLEKDSVYLFEYIAIDDAGNMDTCNWTVEIIEFPQDQALACNLGNVQVSLGENCTALITADMILEGQYGCYEEFMVTVDGYGSDYVGVLVDETAIGRTIQLLFVTKMI